VLLGEEALAVAVGLGPHLFEAIQALLVRVPDQGFLIVGPLRGRFLQVASDDHVSVVEEVAACLVGDDIGLAVDVEDLDDCAAMSVNSQDR
jgi:hypothetical protein